MSNKSYTRGVPHDNWSSPFNEFNSMKYLLFREWMEAIVGMDYRWHPEEYKEYADEIRCNLEKYKASYDTFLPPYMVDVDVSNLCNFGDCIWCNSKGLRSRSPTMLSDDHLLRLADFLKSWGVHSACVAGGGEPLTNPAFSRFLYRMHGNGLKTGVITNGALMSKEQAQAVVDCSSWCGFSVDAGNMNTFGLVHGVDEKVFCRVIQNMTDLVLLKRKMGSSVEVTFKFLLHPFNAEEIYDAAVLAKKIGVDTFHLRPVCWDNLFGQDHEESIDFSAFVDSINNQVERCRSLEDDDFRFYGIRHKFGERFERKVNFKRCLATPMMTTFGADGNVHLCFDCRGRPDWVLCRHSPHPEEILKIWGSEKHRRIIESVNPERCPRCTFGPLNEIIEKVIIEDKMFKDFL